MALVPVLQATKEKLMAFVDKYGLRDEIIRVTIGTLSTQQAIGSPKRQDFALLAGKEVMIEAQFRRSFGQAFTSQPQSFSGLLNDVLNLSLDTPNNRAIFIATLNAVASSLGIAEGVIHCRDDEPDRCGSQIAQSLLEKFGKIKVSLVGFQPAILENLTRSFGVRNVRCSDLNPKNIGSHKFGVEIWDGKTNTQRLVDWCELLLVTSSTIVNNTFDEIREKTISKGKRLIMFGVTGAGVSALLGLERICPLGH